MRFMNQTMKINKKQLLKADKNLVDSIRLQVESLTDGKMINHEHYFIYSIGIESTDAHLNGAMCLNDEYAEEMVGKAAAFFEELGLAYSIWVRDYADFKLEELLKSKGYTPNRTPGSAVMFIDQKIDGVELSKDFKIQKVETRKEINDFGKVIQQAFNKTSTVINRMLETDETLLHKNIIAYVIYRDKTPISAVMIVLSEEVAGIYWVGTVESGRGQGLGSYATQIATNAGFDVGKKRVVLQASALGEGVYKKLGYETVTKYRSYTINV